MSKFVSVPVYQFHELSPRAQNKIVGDLSKNTCLDATLDDIREVLSIIGVEDAKVEYCGFDSQGDGACFTGKYKYKENALEKIIEYAPQDILLQAITKVLSDTQSKYISKVEFELKKNYWQYCHEHTIDFAALGDYKYHHVDYTTIFNALRELMVWSYRQLQTEFEFQTSREQILLANDIESKFYFEDGKPYVD